LGSCCWGSCEELFFFISFFMILAVALCEWRSDKVEELFLDRAEIGSFVRLCCVSGLREIRVPLAYF
jgi:hypothetical protein